MIDLNSMSILEIAKDYRVQAAVNRFNDLREAERAVEELSTKLALAEHRLALIARDIENDSK